MPLVLVTTVYDDLADRLHKALQEECPAWEFTLTKQGDYLIEGDEETYEVEAVGVPPEEVEHLKGFAAGYFQCLHDMSFTK
ncbi:MAG: hypothetical protein SFX18_02660 [Pirellulales bacterium]|nr:hypothetical protein [Pirellulales bacterium]